MNVRRTRPPCTKVRGPLPHEGHPWVQPTLVGSPNLNSIATSHLCQVVEELPNDAWGRFC